LLQEGLKQKGGAGNSPEVVLIPHAFQLSFPATNNVAEYEALLPGLKMALALNVKEPAHHRRLSTSP